MNDPRYDQPQTAICRCMCGSKNEAKDCKYDNLSGEIVCGNCKPDYDKEALENEIEWVEVPERKLEYV